MNTEITPVMWQLMEEAATTWHFASLDLRYEGGPYIDLLNQLAALGYLAYDESEQYGYSVRYTITEQGQQTLDHYRQMNNIPAPPDDLSIPDFNWLAHLTNGEYTQIASADADLQLVVECLSSLSVRGYVEAHADATTHYFALTPKGRQAHADQYFRLHGKYPDV